VVVAFSTDRTSGSVRARAVSAATASAVCTTLLERTITFSVAGSSMPAWVSRASACADSPTLDAESESVRVPASEPRAMQATIRAGHKATVSFGRREAARAAERAKRASSPEGERGAVEVMWGGVIDMPQRLATDTVRVAGARGRQRGRRPPSGRVGLTPRHAGPASSQGPAPVIIVLEALFRGDNLRPMSDLVAAAAARYAEDHTSPFEDQIAAAAAWTQGNTPSPGMMSALVEARLLEALIVVGGAREVLEIGTFTGVGALAMAAALPAGGRVTTLEVNEEIAAVARCHIEASPHADRVELIVGDALETIAGLPGPFDLVYLDAWKADYPAYYDAVLPKLAERGVIVADNLFRSGAAFDATAGDTSTVGIRAFARQVQRDDRMHNVLLTIGDGVMLAWRRPEGAR
jgi:caffeoyl-CoA O-methyltransferase